MSLALIEGPPATPEEAVEHRIFVIRGQRVMLDRGLAALPTASSPSPSVNK